MDDWVKMEIDVGGFNPSAFEGSVARSSRGLAFRTLAELGNTRANQKQLYRLNALCSSDIPERGAFYGWEDYLRLRIDVPSFDPRGVLLAIDGEKWVGMTASSNHAERGFVFNEMTGVVRTHRRQGLGLAMKVLGMSFATDLDVATARTIHHPANLAMIDLNLRLGYVESSWSSTPN